jgi:uncharacterized protein involved in outer membrane biogenesis
LVVAKLSEDRITEIAMKKVSKDIEAPVAIKDVSFNLLRKFPRATIELNDVSFKEQNDTLTGRKQDTILSLNKVFVAVKSKPLMKGIVEILKIDLKDGIVKYKVDSAGVSSIEFLMSEGEEELEETDTTSGKPLFVDLKELTFDNITCLYSDNQSKMAAKVHIPRMDIDGKLEGENMRGSARGSLKLSGVSMEETPLHLMRETKVDFDASYNNDSVSIRDLKIDTDGAKLALLGNVNLGETIQTDVTLKQSEFVLSELAKYLPAKLLNEFGVTKITGKMELDGTIKGNYSDNELPRVDMNVTFEDGLVHTADYPQIKNLNFKGKFTNGILQNNKTTQADFSNFSFNTRKSKFDFAFSVVDIDHPKYDIKTNMQVDLGEFRDYIPDSMLHHIEGRINLQLATKGILPDSIGDDFTDYVLARTRADIELRDITAAPDTSLSVNNLTADIHYQPNQLKIDGLALSVPAYKIDLEESNIHSRFEGSVNNLSEMKVFLDEYNLNTNKSSLKGNLQLENLDQPDYSIDTRIKLNLAEVKNMVPDSLVSELSGEMKAHIRSEAVIDPDSVSAEAMNIFFNKGAYELDIKDFSVSLPDYPDYTINDVSGNISMDSSAIRINKFRGSAVGISFLIDSTSVENLYETVLQNKPEQLKVNTRVSLGDLQYNELMALVPADTNKISEEPEDPLSSSVAAKVKTKEKEEEEKEQEQEQEETEPVNYTMLINGVARVNSFKYDSVYLENISTLFKITDSTYIADQLKFDAFQGHLNTSAKYEMKPNDRVVIEMRNSISKMDINKLLADFNDFEEFYEPSIRSKNLSGKLTSDFYAKVELIGDSLLKDDLRVRGDLQLEDGGVYDFEPATSLADYTNINELDNIQFRNINSQVFIMKSAIYVPETYISSTALDITAFGMQGFGEDYEYHLKMHLSDVLIGKSDKLLKEQKKKGDIADKDERGKAFYLISYSKDGESKSGLDSKRKRSSMSNKIRLQETLLNLRFHPEMFKFETGVYPNQDKTRRKEKDN